MFVKREEYERLVTQAAQCQFLTTALASAEKRAEEAEKALKGERAAKDWQTLQLASRVVTKNGGYGLDHEQPATREAEAKSPHPKGWLREPDEMDEAKLAYYKECYRNAGLSEEKAELRWEAEMRGESPPFECEIEQ
jgi:hypothetical protein